MAKYTITNQKELRRSFWVFCKEFGDEKDGLCKDGIISQSLYERATLY